mmetsp:Transcript_74141/g.130898  ORF Transcript_74141/g.130898 Transcript_74141/m.130898 type:complete len:246 (-) Transcript_74141:1398-2135(-)
MLLMYSHPATAAGHPMASTLSRAIAGPGLPSSRRMRDLTCGTIRRLMVCPCPMPRMRYAPWAKSRKVMEAPRVTTASVMNGCGMSIPVVCTWSKNVNRRWRGMPDSDRGIARPVARGRIILVSSAPRYTTASKWSGDSNSSMRAATSLLDSPVIRAPVSTSAWHLPSMWAAMRRIPSTVQSDSMNVTATMSGRVSVCSIWAWQPSSNRQDRPWGTSRFGVPEKPMRCWNSIEPPSSCPDALILLG